MGIFDAHAAGQKTQAVACDHNDPAAWLHQTDPLRGPGASMVAVCAGCGRYMGRVIARAVAAVADAGPPVARGSDPETSHLAGEDLTRSGRRESQRRLVYQAVCDYPGRTSAELSAIVGLDRHMVARRLPDLAATGQVVRGPPRKCAASNRSHIATTWRPRRIVAKPR